MACYVFLLTVDVLVSYVYGYSLVSNYISDLGSREVIPFPFFHDVICFLGGFITLFTTFFIRKKLKVFYRDSKHSKTFVEIGAVLGLVGATGYMLLGVFSLDRAGPEDLYHGIIAFLSFGGFIASIFFYSLNIILSHKCRLKHLGFFGLSVPIFLFVLFIAVSTPLIEWTLLSSIITFMTILDYYVFKK